MKKNLILISAIFFLLCSSCQEKIDVEKEKAAIIEVINAEGSTFAANDLEGVFALHLQDELSTRYSGNKVYKGWDEIKALFESYVERNTRDTTWTNPRNIKENIVCKVTGNTAWLICDNIWKFEFNNEPQEMSNVQIAFLEKMDGVWKISFNAFVEKSSSE